MVECILATDMANHSSQMNIIRPKLDSNEIKNGENLEKLITDNVPKNNEAQQMILSLVVHTADLSNPAKMNPVFKKWTDIVYTEFFAQGDKEKEIGMTISMLCDRKSTNIHKSQVGFIKFVVSPQFELVKHIIPDINEYLNNIALNLRYCEEQIEKENNLKTSETPKIELKEKDTPKNKLKLNDVPTPKNVLKTLTTPKDGQNTQGNGTNTNTNPSSNIFNLNLNLK